MKIKVIQIGNSKGIRIPKALLEEYGIEDEVELHLDGEGITIRPISKPRDGWKSALQGMHEEGDDELLIRDVFEDEEL